MLIQRRTVTCPTCGQEALLTVIERGPSDRDFRFQCPSEAVRRVSSPADLWDVPAGNQPA
jgi:hypothetical protein